MFISICNINTYRTLEHLYSSQRILDLFRSNAENSSSYEKMLREKNLQLPELQFYINNIAGFLVIVELIFSRRKYHQ